MNGWTNTQICQPNLNLITTHEGPTREIHQMYIIFLRFSANKSQASEFMTDHKEWIKRGVDEGVFLIVGSLKPADSSEIGGGSIVAHNTTLEELQQRVGDDPFVAENVVSAELVEISPNQVDKRLNFLMD